MADDRDDTTDDSASDDGDASEAAPDALYTARAALRAMIGGGTTASPDADDEGASAGAEGTDDQ